MYGSAKLIPFHVIWSPIFPGDHHHHLPLPKVGRAVATLGKIRSRIIKWPHVPRRGHEGLIPVDFVSSGLFWVVLMIPSFPKNN